MLQPSFFSPTSLISDTTIPIIISKQAPTLTITQDHHHHSAITMIKDDLQKQEKQIVVDPLSLKQQESSSANIVPPPLQPPKFKFLSVSQPNSASSSPRFASILSKKKSKVESLESPPCPDESYLQKSKSCGEGRACPPSDDFDLWSVIKHDTPNIQHHYHGSFTKPEDMKESPRTSSIITRKNIHPAPAGKGFRCSCLYIPGFGKAKPIRPKKEESRSFSTDGGVISRTVSLEKFECGSWAPSPRSINPVRDQVEGNDSVSSYFELPSELIRCGGGDDAHSPVAAAFLFDNYKDIKGVLKDGSARGRKSDASPRHVRFSNSSSPASSTCITPRLQKAREEFNAFLEAQTTS